jgi:hypothetical protein
MAVRRAPPCKRRYNLRMVEHSDLRTCNRATVALSSCSSTPSRACYRFSQLRFPRCSSSSSTCSRRQSSRSSTAGASYGTRGIVVFMVLCLLIGSALESLSLRIGFPFGHYYFTGVMGPKLFQLPVLLSLAYVGVGYLAWVVASLDRRRAAKLASLESSSCRVSPQRRCAPGTSRWIQCGPTSTAPGCGSTEVATSEFHISNFFGWLLTAWIFYQAFALWLRHQPLSPSDFLLESSGSADVRHRCRRETCSLAVPSAQCRLTGRRPSSTQRATIGPPPTSSRPAFSSPFLSWRLLR